MNLKGKTALVTGAARRLGRAIALALAERGAHVAVHYRSSEGEAESVVTQALSLGVDAVTVQADLGDPGAAASLVERVSETIGPVDVLVNNASVFGGSSLRDFSLQDLVENIRINTFAPLVLARAFAEQSRPGAIVNMLDTKASGYDAAHAAYQVSKSALLTLTRMMAAEFAPKVRVNGVAPGLILPPPGQDEAFLAQMASTVPLKEHGCAEDVVEAVLFLATSDFVTGQVIYVDGGKHLGAGEHG